LGTAALIALPVLAAAQTSGSSTQSPQSGTTSQQTSDTQSTSSSPNEHLAQARQVLNNIPRASVTGPHASKLNEVRRHFAALEKSYAKDATGSASAPARGSKSGDKGAKSGSWNTHLMALDRALSDLLGAESGDAATSATPGATGTSGAAGALDGDVRADLEKFRTHITQFAAAASGSAASGSMTQGSTGSMGSTGSGSMGSGSTGSAATPSTETTGSASSAPAASGAQSAPPSQSTTSQTTGASGTQSSMASSPQGDANQAREHLTQARQALADLTALPQAQQLQGETRNQVSQLISQFNQLITTQEDWRSAYEQVNTTLTALLSSASAPGSAGTSGSTGTAGAVGTSGSASASLDPAIRGKLEAFRTHLQAFHTAAGGDAASASSSTSTTDPASATPGTGASPSTGSSTSGQTPPGASGSTQTSSASASADTHIAAIERILSEASGGAAGASTSGTTGSTAGTGTGSTTGTGTSGSGTTGSTSGSTPPAGTSSSTASSVTLTAAQLEQIRMHLQQLRQAVRR
jgi:hypothetical protein